MDISPIETPMPKPDRLQCNMYRAFGNMDHTGSCPPVQGGRRGFSQRVRQYNDARKFVIARDIHGGFSGVKFKRIKGGDNFGNKRRFANTEMVTRIGGG